MGICHSCGAAYTEKHQPGFREKCPCGADWHCCANCRFYKAGAREWCSEPAAHDEKPRQEDSPNLCSYFMLNQQESKDCANDKSVEAKRKLAELFGDTPEQTGKQPKDDWMKFDKPDNKDIFS